MLLTSKKPHTTPTVREIHTIVPMAALIATSVTESSVERDGMGKKVVRQPIYLWQVKISSVTISVLGTKW